MKAIGFLNEKGGVGKTTLAVHVAAGLALRGSRVVLIDADPQANACDLLRIPKAPGIYSIMMRDADWDAWLRPVRREIYDPYFDTDSPTLDEPLLWVLPSNDETRGIPLMQPNQLILAERLEEISDWADYIIFDTSPSASLLHTAVYLASDGMVFPVHPNMLSLVGLAQSIAHRDGVALHKEHAGLGEIKTLGIQPTFYRTNTGAHDVGLQKLAEKFKRLLWPALPLRTIFEQSSWAGELMFRFAPDDAATTELWALVDRIENAVKERAS